MKNIFKKIALLTLILVNVYVFMPENKAAEAFPPLRMDELRHLTKDFGDLGTACWFTCTLPNDEYLCRPGDGGWGFPQ